VARETSSGATPKTATGTGALPSKGPMGGQWQFGVDERGKGRLKSFRAKGAKAAKSRSDAKEISQIRSGW